MTEKKTIIVTGAGSGIGEAAALRFAKDGFNVVLNGRNEDKLKRVADQISSADNVLICAGDVSQHDDVKDMIAKTIDRFGRIDVVVNNAAIAVFEKIDAIDPADWQRQLNINVNGPFYVIKEAFEYLKKTQGSIVNVSSVSGIGGDWGGFAYNATKGALSNMTRAMALDFGSQGVRINAVAPSLTKTDMAEFVLANDEVMKKFKDRIPMERAADPEEVADVIAFLASHDARFVNGVILPVDGGLSASNGQPKIG